MGFSNQLKKARLNMHYTQQQVADLMGITKSTYCGYETGKRKPDVDKKKKLARILNTSGDVLLETGLGDNLEQNGEFVAYMLMDKYLTEYAKKIYSLPEEQRQRVYGYIDSLLELE